jgi:hypothetical protein
MRQASKAKPAAEPWALGRAMRGAAQLLNRTGVVASAARKMENGIFFLPAARSKKKRKGHRHQRSSACESPNLASLLHRIAFSRIEQTMSTYGTAADDFP